MKLPQARTEELVEQNLGQETLIYDLNAHKAFNLNETLTIVYKACDGVTTFDELRRRHKFTDDFIYLALDELKSGKLLADLSYRSPFANMNRRQVIKRVGLATMVMLPLIAGLMAPTAANAASGVSGGAGGSGLPDELVGVYGGACNQYGTCAPEYKCAPTSGGMRCCVGTNSGGGSSLLLPGESSSETYSGLGAYYAAQPDPYPCPASTCCSGSGVSGSCHYEIDTAQDEADGQVPGDPYYGYHPYNLVCDCACS